VSLWRQIARGLGALTNRAAADQDVADEVQHYLEQATAAHLARGLSPEEAHRAARLEVGGVTRVREEVRGSGWEHGIETLHADLGYAVRRLLAAPGFTTITVLTLALGIGASTAILSAVNPILFEPLSYPEPGRITMVWEAGRNGARVDGTYGSYHELAARSRSFETLAVFKAWQPTVTGTAANAAEPERLEGQEVSAGYFTALGVSPVLGQDFRPSDDQRGGPRVVILSDRLWRRRFDGDPAIIGRPVSLDDDPRMVVGVMPPGFENVVSPSAELWAPLQYDMADGRAWGHHLHLIGRLRRGVTLDAARRELQSLSPGLEQLAAAAPGGYFPGGFIVSSLQDDITRGVRGTLLAILGAAALVLVIACVNVTNLFLARGAYRQGELALRAALGAGRGRLVRQLLTESLLLALLGGVVGVGFAALGVRLLVALSPPGLPRVDAIRVDATVLAFGLAITTLVGLAVGLVPALQAIRHDLHLSLQQSGRRAVGRRTRGTLVVGEVALAVILLVSSGLLLRSLERLYSVETGFDPSHLLTMQVQTAGHRFDAGGTSARFFAQALEAVRQVPGVSAAALTSQLPLSGDDDSYGVHFDPDQHNSSFRYSVSSGFFETMRIPLRAGRLLTDQDVAGAPNAAVVSEALARRMAPSGSPIGLRLRIGPLDGPQYTVVGVVGDVKQMSLALNESAAVYVTASQWQFADNAMSLVVRSPGDVAPLAPAVRRAIWSVDRDQPIVRVSTMDDMLAATAAERRFALILFEAFALTALVLATAGIYGVLAGSVAERTREIGVRSALGASRRNILALVVRQGLGLTGIGLAMGLAGAALASRVIETTLFGISPLDPVTYSGVIALMAGVSVAAAGAPAWRAARVDPVITLRTE
jgi:predicted permease